MEGGGSKCNVAEKRRRTGNAFDRRIFVATMAAMERKSEEGGRGEGFSSFLRRGKRRKAAFVFRSMAFIPSAVWRGDVWVYERRIYIFLST